MDNVKYFGCFFNADDLKKQNYEAKPLFRIIEVPHITLKYRPNEVPQDLIGLSVTVRVVGYGNNGENEALGVEFLEIPNGLSVIANEIAVPHITLSVAEGGQSVNSKYLSFEPIEPFEITGIIGVMDEDKKVYTKVY